jgi:hypothetical protein
MGDTNVIGGIVKILEMPRSKYLNKNIPVTHFRVQFSQVRNTSIVNLIFWGNLAYDVKNFYKINDYILIEGYISNRNKKIFDTVSSKYKKVEITVLKVYPILLSSNDSRISA